MKNRFRSIFTIGLLAAIAPCLSEAADAGKPESTKDKVSYSVGMNIGNNLKRSGYDVDVDVLANAIKDVVAGKETKLTEQEAREALSNYQKELMAKRDEERKKTAEKNKAAGDAFLAENKKKEGVKTLQVSLSDTNKAEMQYKVITQGTGPTPKATDTVVVKYRGTLIDGKEFDSSAKHGDTSKFQVNRVVRGWTEALQIMPVGSKWELYIPSSLAYQDYGSGPMIEPGATLIFEIGLIGIDNPQPLTSDIIRVPSAEELKAGAKPEVIKADEVEKRAKEEAEKAAKNPKQ